jgi:hypothetical protein
MTRRPRLRTQAALAGLALAVPMVVVAAIADPAIATTSGAGISGAGVTVHRIGTSSLGGGAAAGELRPPSDDDVAAAVKAVANRSRQSRAKAVRGTPAPSGIAPSQTLSVSPTAADSGWEGINHFTQRTVDGGNQWSLVPPDQALCAGGGQMVEGVNNAVQVYSTSTGNAVAVGDLTSMNQLFWQDHEINRTTGIASPHQLGDPSCVYDAGANRFYLTVYDAASDSAGNPTGPSWVDIAVSSPGDATSWSIYQLDTTDDGTGNTPSHPNCPCFADYPHLGTDANGLYITTNEYPSFGSGYDGANVYAIDKAALGAGTADLPAMMFNTARTDPNQGTVYDGFTLAPALAAGTAYARSTMYFLSSDSWSADVPIVSQQILLWKLANTNKISSNPGALRLTHTTVPVSAYYPPPASDQKAGSVPLADCLNVTACSKAVLGTPDKFKEQEYAFDSSDTRMLQAAYANGRVWGALDTAVDVDGVTKAGVAYYVVNPATSTAVKQGTLAVAGNNISYPALGVTAAGKAVMALTLTGRDYFPSAAYVTLNDVAGTPASAVKVVGAGKGPADDFSGYRGFAYNRPRWGDYGAASVVGNTVWIASEYIAQTCTLAEFESGAFTCGDTRTALANWSTHIAKVTP